MNTIQRASLLAVPVLGFLAFSFLRWWRRPTGSARSQLLSAIFALIVLLTHIAEAFDVWPSMGWGQPHSVGHYTDLASAILFVIFVSVAAILAVRSRASAHKCRKDD